MARGDGDARASTSAADQPVRKMRIHKLRGPQSETAAVSLKQGTGGAGAALMDRRISEIVPGLAEIPTSQYEAQANLALAAEIRAERLAKESAAVNRAELHELDTIYDMSVPHPRDIPPASFADEWIQTLKPRPRKISLSPYQAEMINYQRMHLRKNIWFYRDRLSTPRGPCPLHVMKDAYVQGVVDENTLVWGQGLYDWLPMKNVKLLLPMIRTPEVRFGAWVKRTFSLKPALNRIREQRAEYRDPEELSLQVERMR